MNLKRDASLRCADLRVREVHHRFAVEPRLNTVSLDLQPQRVPLALLERRLLLVGNLHQPSAAVGFVDARRVVPLGSHLALPAVDLHGRLDERTEEDARIAVRQLFELHREVEIVVILPRGEVAVLLVGAALADEVALFIHVPFLGAVSFPAREVAAVEEFDLPAGLARQLLDFQIAERGGVAVVLQTDDASLCQAVFGSRLPFAAVLACEPVVGPGVEFEDFAAVEPMLDMAVVADDARRVPLALRIDDERIGVREVHGVVHAQPLPRFEFRRGVLRLPAVVVDQLIFGSGDVGNREIGVLDHMIEHAAVAARGEFPVPVENEVFILFFGDDVSRKVAAVARGLDAAVHDMPRLRERIAVEVFPLVERLAVEEQLPAVGDFGFGEGVVTGPARAEAGRDDP